MRAAVFAAAAIAAASTAAAFIGWRDGDPMPWLLIGLVAGPLSAVVGGVAWARAGTEATALTRAATLTGVLVTALWAVVLTYILARLE